MKDFNSKMNLIGSVTISALVCVVALSARADDWPQFLGPNSDATTAEKGLPRAWPPNGPKILWTVSLGPGYGGAAIRDGHVYVLDRPDEKQDVLRCFDLETGKEEWTYPYDAPGRIDHDGSRSTPAVTATRVFTVGPFGQLHCLDKTSHQVVWKKNLLSDYGGAAPRWAVAQSPLLYEDLLIVAPQANDVGLVALDQATGRERWRSPGIGPMGYGSPMILHLQGVDQAVIVNPKGVAAVNAKDGKLLWQYAHACKIPIPNVTALADGRLFVTGAYNAGSAIIQVARQSGEWNVQEIAPIAGIGSHCHPALAYQNYLYVLCNINERADGLVCFDSNGKLKWQTKRNPSLDKGGSILTADGLIYIMDGARGELHIVQASPDGFKSLAKAKVLEGKEIWGPLALANGKLVLRDQTQMKCLDLKAH